MLVSFFLLSVSLFPFRFSILPDVTKPLLPLPLASADGRSAECSRFGAELVRSVAGEDRCRVGLDWELACRPSEAGMAGVGGEDREVGMYPVRSAILMSDVLHTRYSHV